MVCRAGSLPASSGADFCVPIKMYEEILITTSSSIDMPFLRKVNSLIGKLFLNASLIAGGVGILILAITFGPSLFFSVVGTKGNEAVLARAPGGGFAAINEQEELYQPQFNQTLPKTNMLIIPSIGVEGEINEAAHDDYETALRKGIWHEPSFGTPYARSQPTILAAHRFGYLAWTNQYRRENSFYNLPKLAVGETVEIIWKQRQYVYEIYDESEGKEMVDYNADLILYTCEALNSDVRIFKYARLLEV